MKKSKLILIVLSVFALFLSAEIQAQSESSKDEGASADSSTILERYQRRSTLGENYDRLLFAKLGLGMDGGEGYAGIRRRGKLRNEGRRRHAQPPGRPIRCNGVGSGRWGHLAVRRRGECERDRVLAAERSLAFRSRDRRMDLGDGKRLLRQQGRLWNARRSARR